MSLDLEPDAIACTRAISFAVLCVLWVYTLSLGELRETFNDAFSSCVDRFAIVLVADIYVVSGYVIFAIGFIAWQHKWNSSQQHAPPVGVVVSSDVIWGVHGERQQTDEDVDVHAAFRLAQENARKGNHSR